MTTARRFPVIVGFLAALLAGGVSILAAAGEDAVGEGPRTGAVAPDFSLRSVDGRGVSFSSLRGRVVVLSFWDCYADVCFTSVKVLDDMFRRYPKEKFALVTLCYEIPPAMAENNYKKLLENCGMGQVILIDDQRAVKRLYGVSVAPTTFLVGADGVIWDKLTTVPELRGEEFKMRIDSLVNALP